MPADRVIIKRFQNARPAWLLPQLSALAGIIGPLLFGSTILVSGWLRPKYDPVRQTVSELAVGQYAWIQTLNFAVFGLLIIIFGIGLPSGIHNRLGGILLSGLICLWGLGFVLFVFVPIGRDALHQRLHFLLLDGVILLFPVACFSATVVLWRETTWRWVGVYSLASGGFGVLVVFCWLLWRQPILHSRILGVYERIIILFTLIWVAMLALRLRRLISKKGTEAVVPAS